MTLQQEQRHTVKQEQYNQGRDAFTIGLQPSDNPYDVWAMDEKNSWSVGWSEKLLESIEDEPSS